MTKKLLICVVVLIILFLVIIITKHSNYEHLTSDEAIKNIASIYNNDNMIAKNLNITGTFNLLPTGIIVAWTGSTPPFGWTLCDGTNGTPNLQGKFVLGNGNGYTLKGTGGEVNHTLTISEMPSHTHNVNSNTHDDGWCKNLPCGFQTTDRPRNYDGDTSQATYNSNNSLTTFDSTGGNQPHNNMPPYYVLAYIMKL